MFLLSNQTCLNEGQVTNNTHTHTHTYIYIYIYIYHHVVSLSRISLTLSHHFSLSFIASGRSSGLPPVSSHCCCMYVRAGHPAFAWPYAGSTSLIYIYIYIYNNDNNNISNDFLISVQWFQKKTGLKVKILKSKPKYSLHETKKVCFFSFLTV